MANPSFPIRTEQDRVMTPAYLAECFDLVNDTLFWKTRPASHFSRPAVMNGWNAKWAGKEAGSIDSKGYLQVRVCGVTHLVHRIIWLMTFGDLPGCIDHIDGNPLNNAIANLRAVTHQENMANQKRRSDNKTGLMGVHWLPAKSVWIAKISNRHIGTFEVLLDACAARKAAEIGMNFHANHGRHL